MSRLRGLVHSVRHGFHCDAQIAWPQRGDVLTQLGVPLRLVSQVCSDVRLDLKRFRYRPAHWSPHSFATFPQTPLHRRVLIHLGVLKIFPGELLFGAELLIILVLVRSPDVCLIVCRIREDVISFLSLFDHSHLAGRKVLQLPLLRRRFGSDDLKAGGHEHALSVLRGGLRAGAAD
jgi:hypothetical protein